MKYALIKNTPLGSLLDRTNNAVQWTKYGFDPAEVQRSIVQGEDDNGNYSQIIPISKQDIFDGQLAALESKIENNASDNDSIEVIEQSAKDTLTAQIETKRAIAKAASI